MSNDQNQVDIYIVAGDASVGKSDAINYIVGKTRDQRYNYETLQTTTGEDLDVFFRTQSLQEAEIDVKDCITKLNIKRKRKVSAIIIALRTDIYKGFPKAEEYINFYAKHGYNIKFVAELFAKGKEQKPGQTSLEECCDKKYPYKKFPWAEDVDMKSKKIKQALGFKGKKIIQPKRRL